MSGSQVDNPSSGTGCQAARLTTRPLAKASSSLGLSGSLGKTRSRTLVIKSVVTESNATCPQRGLVAERRQRRSVAILVQAHAFVLAEGDGPRPLCMVPRAQPLSQVLKMPRSLVLQLGLSAVPLVNRTLRGVLGQPVHECLRPASEGMQAEGPGICSGTAEGEVSICETTKRRRRLISLTRMGVCCILCK